jgi:hypothetical protein
MASSGDGAAGVDLYVDRFDDFDCPVTINNVLTGASFEAEIRVTPDATGTPLATMTITAPTVGVSTTTFTMSLAQAVVGALPAATELGDDAEFYWDLKMTLAGKRKTLFRGKFTVIAGVTRP